MEDGGGQDGVLDGGEPMAVKLLGFCLAFVDAPGGVDKLLYRDVAVAPLPVEVSGHGRRVFHAIRRVSRPSHATSRVGNALEGVHPCLSGVVVRHLVTTVGLINGEVALSENHRQKGLVFPRTHQLLPFLPYNTSVAKYAHQTSGGQSTKP